jgi:hypothetical protein
VSRNTEENEYLYLPFPKMNGKTHPALKRLQEEAQLLSLAPWGFNRKGVANYAAALLIDRDMKLHPEDYQDIPKAGFWFPPNVVMSALQKDPQDPPTPTEEEPENNDIRARAKKAALAWSNDDD